jgi:hypothetical protein
MVMVNPRLAITLDIDTLIKIIKIIKIIKYLNYKKEIGRATIKR